MAHRLADDEDVDSLAFRTVQEEPQSKVLELAAIDVEDSKIDYDSCEVSEHKIDIISDIEIEIAPVIVDTTPDMPFTND